MTPAARVAAAIAVLDRWLAGTPVEQALTNWGRASRFAGSGDRLAVRDLVFDAVRRRRSAAAMGGADSGRGLILGLLRQQGTDLQGIFTGDGHAPEPLTAAEQVLPQPPQGLVALDCPDWLAPQMQAALGADFAPVIAALRDRAPVFLRVNIARLTRDQAITRLAAEGIGARAHPLADTAVEVVENARKIKASASYLEGWVEVQDAASQAVVQALPLVPGMRVLDACAGGGGKTLAMAARAPMALFAHDAVPDRMRDLPPRADRAGVQITRLAPGDPGRAGPYDLVLADVPCSGSGSWRRAPEGKWRLTPARLADLTGVQAGLLRQMAPLVAPGGHLAYATCSLLAAENDAQVARFLQETPGWRLADQRRFTPLEGGDGFFLAILGRTANL